MVDDGHTINIGVPDSIGAPEQPNAGGQVLPLAERIADYVQTHARYESLSKREAMVEAVDVLVNDPTATQDFLRSVWPHEPEPVVVSLADLRAVLLDMDRMYVGGPFTEHAEFSRLWDRADLPLPFDRLEADAAASGGRD